VAIQYIVDVKGVDTGSLGFLQIQQGTCPGLPVCVQLCTCLSARFDRRMQDCCRYGVVINSRYWISGSSAANENRKLVKHCWQVSCGKTISLLARGVSTDLVSLSVLLCTHGDISLDHCKPTNLYNTHRKSH